MKPRKTTYLAHRWIGLIISLQLLAWSVGGFTFSILDIDDVHGDFEARMRVMSPMRVEELPSTLQETLIAEGIDEIGTITMIDRGLGAFWEIRGGDGRWIGRADLTGELAGLITEQQAVDIALDDFLPEAEVKRVELIEADPPGEYRGGRLPVYRVDMDHPKETHIYINASNGRIMARRNKSWRTFDFFWMLHTMDYQERDDFNHPLLTIASLFAIAASSTGLVLWGWRSIPKFFKRRKAKAAQSGAHP
jgi:uncharacterized iron-regulated membrane protein